MSLNAMADENMVTGSQLLRSIILVGMLRKTYSVRNLRRYMTNPAHEENYGEELEWMGCWIEGGRFHAACGPQKLADVLNLFRGLIEAGER
jgi:hypothetical protein